MIEAMDETLEKEIGDGEVLAYFTAKWCGPCRALAPIMDAISKEVRVLKIDIDESPRAVSSFGIRGAPTVIAFRGGKEHARQVGATSKDRILALLR